MLHYFPVSWTTLSVRRRLCVATETRPLDRLGQLGEFERDSNTDSELESNTDSPEAVYAGEATRCCALQQRQGISTGLASSVSRPAVVRVGSTVTAKERHVDQLGQLVEGCG